MFLLKSGHGSCSALYFFLKVGMVLSLMSICSHWFLVKSQSLERRCYNLKKKVFDQRLLWYGPFNAQIKN